MPFKGKPVTKKDVEGPKQPKPGTVTAAVTPKDAAKDTKKD